MPLLQGLVSNSGLVQIVGLPPCSASLQSLDRLSTSIFKESKCFHRCNVPWDWSHLVSCQNRLIIYLPPRQQRNIVQQFARSHPIAAGSTATAPRAPTCPRRVLRGCKKHDESFWQMIIMNSELSLSKAMMPKYRETNYPTTNYFLQSHLVPHWSKIRWQRCHRWQQQPRPSTSLPACIGAHILQPSRGARPFDECI